MCDFDKIDIPEENDASTLILNFDGKKAACLCPAFTKVKDIKTALSNNSSVYDNKVETAIYDWEFVSSSYEGTIYKEPYHSDYNYLFLSDRTYLTITIKGHDTYWDSIEKTTFKKVDKSYFKVGRSRTPSSTLHE